MEDKIQLLDELYNNMEAKLKRYGYLSKRRVLQVPINVLSYAPLYKTKSDEICTSIEEVKIQQKRMPQRHLIIRNYWKRFR